MSNNRDIELRGPLREVLAAAHPRELTGPAIKRALAVLGFDGVTEVELLATIDWNLSSGYIDFKVDRELECKKWGLTEAGRAKEGIHENGEGR